MTTEKIKAVTALYRDGMLCHFPPVRGGTDAMHVRWMLDEIDAFADAGRVGKAFRWLGFVQGWLWAANFFTIDEIKNHNAPDHPDVLW